MSHKTLLYHHSTQRFFLNIIGSIYYLIQKSKQNLKLFIREISKRTGPNRKGVWNVIVPKDKGV